MARVVVSQFVTLDGVVEDPGGSENSPFGGWAFKFDRGPDGDKFKYDELMAADTLLLGRKTWEGFAEAWPSREGEFADKFNNMRKLVVSSTLADGSGWTNSEVVRPDEIAEKIGAAREQDGGDILVNGSVQLVGALMEHDLVDVFNTMVFPTVVGGGKTLFPEGSPLTAFEITSTQQAGETLVVSYSPKR